MRPTTSDLITYGIVGGVIAGAVVAAWFLVVDFAVSQPFHTPALLASIVLGEEFTGPWPRLVFIYTILHFGVFTCLGLAGAWLLKAIDVDPGLIVGALFGISVLNTVHYAGLLILRTNLLTVVPVEHVLAANVLGGMVMMAYLHRALRHESPFGWNVLKASPVLYHGLITGVVGAAAVAFWFFMIDTLAGTPFHTPATLGSAILLGARGPGDVQLNLGVLAAYSFLHVAAFVLVGIAFVWLVRRRGGTAQLWVRAAVVLVLLEGLFFGTVIIVNRWVLAALGEVAVLVANILAVVTMALWTWRTDRRAGVRLGENAAAAAPSLPGS